MKNGFTFTIPLCPPLGQNEKYQRLHKFLYFSYLAIAIFLLYLNFFLLSIFNFLSFFLMKFLRVMMLVLIYMVRLKDL